MNPSFTNGGINRLLVLHLGTKDHTAIFSIIGVLLIEIIAELAKKYGKEKINAGIAGWINDYNTSKSTFTFFSPSRLSMTNVPSRVRSNGVPPSALLLWCNKGEA